MQPPKPPPKKVKISGKKKKRKTAKVVDGMFVSIAIIAVLKMKQLTEDVEL